LCVELDIKPYTLTKLNPKPKPDPKAKCEHKLNCNLTLIP